MTTLPNVIVNKSEPIIRSLIHSLWVALLIFIGVLVLFEVTARVSQAQNPVAVRSVGNYHAQFETKWFKLKDYVRENGGVDVILLGNSMVNTGIDAEILSREYETQTAIKLRIFNFGVEGLDLHTLSNLASILVSEYHPKTLFLFTEMREYGPITNTSVTEQFQKDTWFQFKEGKWSLAGWLIDHSAGLQYLLPFRNWSMADFPDTILLNLRRFSETTVSGYEADRAIGEGINVPPDPNDPDEKKIFDLYRDFSPDPARLKDLLTILNLKESGTAVFVTEMPIYPTYYDYFGGETIHQAFLKEIEDEILDQDGVFITPVDPELIPMKGRVDNHHLNLNGAPIYSTLLASELADLCVREDSCFRTDLTAEVSK